MSGLLLVALLIGFLLAQLVGLQKEKEPGSSPPPSLPNYHDDDTVTQLFLTMSCNTGIRERLQRALSYVVAYVWSFRIFATSVYESLKNRSQIPIQAIRQVRYTVLFGRGILMN